MESTIGWIESNPYVSLYDFVDEIQIAKHSSTNHQHTLPGKHRFLIKRSNGAMISNVISVIDSFL